MVSALWAALVVGLLPACSVATKEDESFDLYQKQVSERIHKKWQQYHAQSPNDRAQGELRVFFYVSPEGRVERIHVKNNATTDPVLTRFTVKAIQDAKLPPMPEELIPLIQRKHDGFMELGMGIYLNEPGKGGDAASRGQLSEAELRKVMEKRWGMWLEKGRRKTSGMKDEEVQVSLTAQESGARQAQPPAKADGGKKPPVKLTQTPKERYIQRVRQAVEKKWRQYSEMELAGITYGRLKAEFYVNKRGGVEGVKVVDDQQSYRELTLFTLRAIQDAEIPAMPADVIPSLPMKDPERLKIDYHVLIY